MKSSVLENIRECCSNPKSNLIFYDGADTADLPILICDSCIDNVVFQKFIISKFKLTSKTKVRELLENYLKN
ncbi:MAG: hypothetical protein HKP26_06915 [Nitrosopumilus sp.]|nr:hypothetical protein [Nitrosopumilus sp.]